MILLRALSPAETPLASAKRGVSSVLVSTRVLGDLGKALCKTKVLAVADSPQSFTAYTFMVKGVLSPGVTSAKVTVIIGDSELLSASKSAEETPSGNSHR